MRGWYRDNYRHSLAARGIRTSFVLKYGRDIPAQLHTGSLNVGAVESVHRGIPFKPDGGFWTSTYLHEPGPSGERSSWQKWSLGENFKPLAGEKSVLVRPIKSARVFEVDNEGDIKWLLDRYGVDFHGDPKVLFPFSSFFHNLGNKDLDWDKVARDFDGIRVTQNAAWKFHNRKVDGVDLNCWDAEGTVWFRDVFKKKVPLEMKFETKGYKCSDGDVVEDQSFTEPKRLPIKVDEVDEKAVSLGFRELTKNI